MKLLSRSAKKRQARAAGAAQGRSRTLGFEPLECRAMLSLTHLYAFNDGTADDSVGQAHGTLVNGASVVQGGLALYNTDVSSGDDSAVQYAQLPADLLSSGDATIEVWFAAPDGQNWSRVFDIGNQSGNSGDSYLYFTPDNGGGSRAGLRPSGAGERAVAASATDDGLTHMVAVVVDSSAGELRLYVDGAPEGVTLLNGASAGSVNDTLAYLGRSLFDADPGFSGWIDEVRVYDHAAPASEILVHANAGALSALPGDYDNDADVDQDDYLVWRNSYGASGSQPADGNQDGQVDAGDYTIWRDNLGQTLDEPADLVLQDESQTYASLSGTVVEVSGSSELHLTSAGNPLSGSSIHLNSDDAWLFFDNVKPSEVSSGYLSQVRVNGAPAFLGLNVRVVQYELGAVVIPHTPGYEPLEVFTGPQHSGDSQTLGQYTYYNTPQALGAWDSNISSFRLKRGYMATIATEADGSGFSKVYVAQDHDLHVSLLPTEFDNQVQFVRVLPWRWVVKKGSSDLAPETLDAGWHYNWNNSLNSPLDWEYVPIRQQRYWPGYPYDKQDSTHLLGYNEPNNPVEDAYTTLDNGDVDLAIALWPEFLATGLRVGSPAVTDGGKAWLYEFMDKAIANNLRVDYIAIHNYQAGHSGASLQSWLKDVYDRYHLPIWLTEFNNGANWTGGADPTYAQNAQAINEFITMMDNTPWIERYSIYSAVEAVREMTYSDGSLTPAGQVYYDNASPIGYVQEFLPSGNSEGRSIAQLPLDGHTLDTSGFGANGYAFGTPGYVAGQSGQAIDLDGADDYLQLPDDVASGDEFSFAGWVKWDGGGNWQRIFDFGNDTSSYLFLTPSNGSVMRFAIKNGGSEHIVQTSTLPTGQWAHVAVTLGSGSAKLYVNGSLVDTNNSVSIKPSDFNPARNYLGDSQYSSDPLFNGSLDDVLITDYVLTQSQIAGLMDNTPPEFSTDTIAMGPVLWGVPFNGTIAGLASDSDAGDSVTYGKAHGPAWLTVAPNGTLSGIPSVSVAPHEFVVTATDSRGATTYSVLTVSYSGGPFITAGLTAPATPPTPGGQAESTSPSEPLAVASDNSAVELILAAASLTVENAHLRDAAWEETEFNLAEADLSLAEELGSETVEGDPFDTAFAYL